MTELQDNDLDRARLARLERDLVDFVLWCGLVRAPEEVGVFREKRYARLVSLALPSASPAALLLAAKWLAVFCQIDDCIDVGGSRPGALFDAILNGGDFGGTPIECAVVAGARHVLSVAQHWSPRGEAALRRDLRELGEAFVVERRHARSGTLPTVDDYLALRRVTVGVAPFFSLLDSRASADAIRECALAVGLANDLATADRERARGDWSNLVLVWERMGARRVEALAVAREALCAAEARVEALGEPEALAWVRGHAVWARETARYRSEVGR